VKRVLASNFGFQTGAELTFELENTESKNWIESLEGLIGVGVILRDYSDNEYDNT